MRTLPTRLRLFLRHPIAIACWAASAAFLAYGSMYAFRKPFAAASFEGLQCWGIDYKIVLVLAQLLGYLCSKFLGVKIISELRPGQRVAYLFGLLGIAELALLLFAVTPFPYRWVWLFFNGLPLGMVFGVVFSFLEGRRFTELMSLGLGASIIFASGFVKSVGLDLLMVWHVSAWWMPAVVGVLALPTLFLSVWMLVKIPVPDAADIAARAERLPMTAAGRRFVFKKYAVGIVLLVAVYIVLTAFRDIRDNFAVEIWTAVGYGDRPKMLARTELNIALLVLLVAGGLSFVRNNVKAFALTHACILLGGLVMGLSTWAFQQKMISPVAWMTASGLGLFLAYTMFQGILFERMIASFREAANVGFLMYLADSIGYLGSAGVLLWRNFGAPDISWLDFFVNAAYATAVATGVFATAAWIYFSRRLARALSAPPSILLQTNAP